MAGGSDGLKLPIGGGSSPWVYIEHAHDRHDIYFYAIKVGHSHALALESETKGEGAGLHTLS